MNIEKELRRNVKELQTQLQRAYERIKVLEEEIHTQNKREFYNDYFSKSKSGMSGWDMMDDPPEYVKKLVDELGQPEDD